MIGPKRDCVVWRATADPSTPARRDQRHSKARRLIVGVALTFLAVPGVWVPAQSCTTPSKGANIDASGATQLYLDGTAGSDRKDCGAGNSPCRSIGFALTQAASHPVAEVIVNSGTYREAIALPSAYNEKGGKTLVLRAAKVGTVIIDGADLWVGWTHNRNGTYSKAWPYRWGYAGQPFKSTGGPSLSCLGLRREMLFINGARMTQQLRGPLKSPGTFFVVDDQGDPSKACPTLSGNPVLTVYPPAGTKMASAEVEVAVRAGLFTTPNGASNLRLSGLVFQHDNSPANNVGQSAIHLSGADQRGEGRNVLLDNDISQDNNWTGLYSVSNQDITIRNSTFTRNGENGLTVQKSKDFLFSGNTVSFNSWRAYADCPACTGWDMEGAKFLNGHGIEVEDSMFTNNLTGGLWFDFDNRNICVQNSVMADNLTNGIFVEASPGPILLYRDRIYGNHGNGVQTSNSENAVVRQSTIYNNGAAAFFIGGQVLPRPVKNWETGARFSLIAKDWVFDGVNFATARNGLPKSYLLGTALDSISPFTSTLWTDYNNWYSASDPAPFHIPGSPKTVAQWKSLIENNGFIPGQDVHSSQTAVTSSEIPSVQPCIGSDCTVGTR